MNRRLNGILESVRLVIEEDGEEDVVASGPDTPPDVGGDSTADAAAGDGGAVNPSDVGDTLDLYLSEIADLLTIEYDYSDEEAMNFVFNAAATLEDEGKMPTIPDDDATDEQMAEWLGIAKTCMFAGEVLQKAREMKKKD